MPPHPLHPDAPTEDWIPLVGAAMGFAVCLGTAAVALVLLLVRRLVAAGPVSGAPDPFAPPGVLLLLGTLGACTLAFATTWVSLRPIANSYRQGGLALVAALVTLVLGFLCTPVYHFLGPAGLAGIALLGALGAIFLGRSAHRLGHPAR
jgi:hypothetical protein